MTENKFYEELEKIGVSLSQVQKKQLEIYYELLIEWNKKINLTTIVQKEQVYLKHFYDSATIVKVVDLKQVSTLCDIGTGAGFPGLVLKILFPNLKITLIDSLQKRVLFLNEVINKLELKGIEAIHVRAEEYAFNHREKFEIVTSRAVAHLSTLLEYAIPIVKINGYFIPLKGDIAQEIKDSKGAMDVLDVKLECQEKFKLPIENSNRTIMKFKKIQKTPVKYPRKFSEMKKSPL